MKIYIKPMMSSELFMTNEYVAACFSIACKVADKETNPVTDTVWKVVEWEKGDHIVSHTKGSGTCGASSSNYITTDEYNNITSIAELNSQQGWLYGKIIEYEDLTNDKIVNEGDYVAGTTESSWAQDNNTWHHWGYLVASDSKHPNHS